MSIIQQFFYQLRLVLMQSLSCVIPFCRCKYAGYEHPHSSRGTQNHGNKDRRHFEHVVGSIYGNFDPQTGIPIQHDIDRYCRPNKHPKKHKYVAQNNRHRRKDVKKNEMNFGKDRRHVFGHVSILNMVLGEKIAPGSSMSRKKECCSNLKGHLSSDDTVDYSSGYNDTNKNQFPGRSGCSRNRQHSDFTPSTPDFRTERPQTPTNKTSKSEFEGCARPMKPNLRKLQLQIKNSEDMSCTCHARPNSSNTSNRFRTVPYNEVSSDNARSTESRNDLKQITSYTKIQEWQLASDNSLEKCITTTTSNVKKIRLRIASSTDEDSVNDSNCCPTTRNQSFPFPNIKESVLSLDNYVISTKLSLNKFGESTCACDDKVFQPSPNNKSAFDNYISPTSSKINPNKTYPTYGQEANHERDHYISTTTLKLKKKPCSANSKENNIRYEEYCTTSNTSDDDKTCATCGSKHKIQRDNHFSPTASKLMKSSSHHNPPHNREVKIAFDLTSSDDDKLAETIAVQGGKYECVHKPSNTTCKLKKIPSPCIPFRSSSNSSENNKIFPLVPVDKESKYKPRCPNTYKTAKEEKECDHRFSTTTLKLKKIPRTPSNTKIATPAPEYSSSTTSDDNKSSIMTPANSKELITRFKELDISKSSHKDNKCNTKYICKKNRERPSYTKLGNCKCSCRHDNTDSEAYGHTEESGPESIRCLCRMTGTCECKPNIGVYRKCSCSHTEHDQSSTSDQMSDPDCKCSCHKREIKTYRRYSNTSLKMEGSKVLYPVKNVNRRITHVKNKYPTSASSNEEQKIVSDIERLTMDEEHQSFSDSNITYKCSCDHSLNYRKRLKASRSSDSVVISDCNICITDGKKLQIDKEARNTNIPKCVINHLLDHNVTFHIVKVCDDKF